MLRRIVGVWCGVIVIATAQVAAGGPKYEIVDGHLHYLNFVQETSEMAALFRAMDEAGVTDTVVIGMPLVKKWDEGDERRPTYYMDNDSRVYWYSATDILVARAVQDLPRDKQARLHPFLCGFNSADRNAVDHVERMLALYPNFWQGIGEVFLRHDDCPKRGRMCSFTTHVTTSRVDLRHVCMGANWFCQDTRR